MERIHIGTSGWSYAHWRGSYYPPGLASKNWLHHYSAQFSTTEINGSFYRLPTPETVLQWMEQVPEDFVFCPKMSRYLTHMKKLKDPEEPLERFFTLFEPMRERMGPVLLQLPPMLPFSYERTDYFFERLHKDYPDRDFVLEVRHPGWLEPDALSLLFRYGIGFVISQSKEAFPYLEITTSKHVYLRFHGPEALYASPYTDEQLGYYAKRFGEWVREGREVWAFFNNDIHGYAPVDAQRLIDICRREKI
jgi:uncharacterized protein YecE (DUF72 family)